MNNKRFSWGIREKLTLLFFGVTFIAVFTNFLIVVPRLESQLRGNQLSEMRRAADTYGPALQAYQRTSDNVLTAFSYADAILSKNGQIGQLAGARVDILKPLGSPGPQAQQTAFKVFMDTSGLTPTASTVSDRVAQLVVQSGHAANGTVEIGDHSHAEAAVPIFDVNNQVIGVGVFSTSLSGVSAVVKQQARRNLIAGMFALGISLIIGLFASNFIARRIKRLEHAARAVAAGNFTEPLVVDSGDELGQLAQAFNNMQERLGRADRARKAFIANASHELRTPLFSLGGYVELMREEELDAQTQREFLDTMHEQIGRLTKLATDLLDLSRIDTGSLGIQPEDVDVEEVVSTVAREFEPRAVRHEANIEVAIAPGLVAFCDPDRLAQIVRILIDNALSHTPDGTGIRVFAERRDGAISVSVQDNGPGIDPDDLTRIFDRFHTGDKTGGTGLGLSIANELASAMNGGLSVQSQAQNTIFTLDLPVANESA